MYIYNIHIYIYYIYYIYIYIHTCTLYIYVNSCNNTYFNIACYSNADVMHSLFMVCTRDWKKLYLTIIIIKFHSVKHHTILVLHIPLACPNTKKNFFKLQQEFVLQSFYGWFLSYHTTKLTPWKCRNVSKRHH